MRFRHPCAWGMLPSGLLHGRQGVPRPMGVGICHDKGVVVTLDNRLTRLEALLFLSQQPLTSRRLAQLAGLADGTKARTLVRALNRRYDGNGSAFRVEEVAGGFQLMTRSKFAPWLRRLCPASPEVRLSPPSMETLAVVAYRQPVLRAEIEAIRGVQSGEVLRQLIQRNLVRIAGRSDELGRPFLYGTTKQFLQVFGLRHLDELPRAEALRSCEPTPTGDAQNRCDSNIPNQFNQSQAAAEEENVKTLTTKNQQVLAPNRVATMTNPQRNDSPANQGVFAKHEDEDDIEKDFEEEDDEDDEDEVYEDEEDLDEEDDEDEEDDDEDLDDEPWEEVDDDDDDLDDDDDDDWDEDEDWEDDDWDEDEDEDWDEDEDEKEEEEKDDEAE